MEMNTHDEWSRIEKLGWQLQEEGLTLLVEQDSVSQDLATGRLVPGLRSYLVIDAEGGVAAAHPTLSGVEGWVAEGRHRGLGKAAPRDATAKELVEERGSYYGAPEDNHAATADFFSTWCRRKHGATIRFDAEDVVAFNVLQKLSRAANALKDDNWRDVQGYAQNALDMPAGGRLSGRAPVGYSGVGLAGPRTEIKYEPWSTLGQLAHGAGYEALADGNGGVDLWVDGEPFLQFWSVDQAIKFLEEQEKDATWGELP